MSRESQHAEEIQLVNNNDCDDCVVSDPHTLEGHVHAPHGHTTTTSSEHRQQEHMERKTEGKGIVEI